MSQQSIIITGAGSGIGLATARACAARGDVVGVLGRDEQQVRTIVTELKSRGEDAFPLKADIVDRDSLRAAIEKFIGLTGHLDGVINSAGVHGAGSLETIEPDEWDDIVETNLTGTFNVAKYTLPHLLKTGGSFVAIGSIAGTTGSQNTLAYAASKHGVTGLVRAMALDFGPRGVRANQICPGITKTPMADQGLAGLPSEVIAGLERSIPVGRFAEPEEIATLALYLTSADSRFVNGASFMIDGGATAGLFAPAPA
jgi:NAD(P)-dependent dehydrogenase (short-subunit alcohol dehydrogenase family)